MNNCTNCNYANEEDAKNCINCGQKFNKEVVDFNENESSEFQGDAIVISDEEKFIGRKHEYFERMWENEKNKKGRFFNIPAFFATFFWLGYRKMYQPILYIALLFLAVDVFLVLIKYEYPAGFAINPIDRYIGIGISIILAMMGNKMYRKHVNKKIEQINNTTQDQGERDILYEKKGGRSWLGVLYALLIMAFVYFIPSMLLPMNIDQIEQVQISTIEYEANGESSMVSMENLLDRTFDDGNWAYKDKGKDETYINYTGTSKDDFDIIVTFLLEKDSDYIEINEIQVDGESVEFDESFGPFDFLLNFNDL